MRGYAGRGWGLGKICKKIVAAVVIHWGLYI
jgi:hypothetical protein